MKAYFKILEVTLAIQIMGHGLTYWCDDLLSRSGTGTVAPVFVGGFFLLLSMIVGLILAVRWYGSWKNRLLTILLLPTNYTWLLYVIAVVKLIGGILDILEDIPPNFG